MFNFFKKRKHTYHFHATAKDAKGQELTYDGLLRSDLEVNTIEDYTNCKDAIQSALPQIKRDTLVITSLSLLSKK